LFCHWSLLMPLAPAGQSIQLLICHISRQRLCHRSPQDNQSKSWEKVWPLVLLSLGMVSMTPGTSLLLVYIRLGISSKIVPVCEAFNSSRKFFSIQIFGVMPSNWNGLLSLVASLGTSRAEHTTFYMSYQQIETLLSVNHKTIPTMKVYLYPYIQAINLNLRRRCGQTEIVCHCSSTSRAEHTTSYRGRATTSFISYHQLKTLSLLSKDNQSRSWKKVGIQC